MSIARGQHTLNPALRYPILYLALSCPNQRIRPPRLKHNTLSWQIVPKASRPDKPSTSNFGAEWFGNANERTALASNRVKLRNELTGFH